MRLTSVTSAKAALSVTAVALIVAGSASAASALPVESDSPTTIETNQADPADTETFGSIDADTGSARIIGGSEASSQPYAARLLSGGRGICTSSLIAPKFILTAAHCVTSNNLSFRINSDNDSLEGGEVVKMAKVTHARGADISVVELEREVKGTYIKLAAQNPPNGATVEIFGWGATKGGGNEGANQAKKLKVAKVKFSGVGRDHKGGPALTLQRMDGIAAGGDSGGPAVYNGEQVGVASTSDRSRTTWYSTVADNAAFIKQVAGL